MKEIYEDISYIIKGHNIGALAFDDYIMLTGLDAMLIIDEEKMKVYEMYYPIDFEIPTTGERLATIRLADPKCFDQLVEFCHEFEEERRKETQNSNKAY